MGKVWKRLWLRRKLEAEVTKTEEPTKVEQASPAIVPKPVVEKEKVKAPKETKKEEKKEEKKVFKSYKAKKKTETKKKADK